MKRFAMIMSLSLGVVAGAGEAQAESSREAPRALPSAAPAADQEYSRGMAAKNAKNWPAAVGSFQKAVSLRPAFPEAWNELGFALRSQGNYPNRSRPTTRRYGSGRTFPKPSSISARLT